MTEGAKDTARQSSAGFQRSSVSDNGVSPWHLFCQPQCVSMHLLLRWHAAGFGEQLAEGTLGSLFRWRRKGWWRLAPRLTLLHSLIHYR